MPCFAEVVKHAIVSVLSTTFSDIKWPSISWVKQGVYIQAERRINIVVERSMLVEILIFRHLWRSLQSAHIIVKPAVINPVQLNVWLSRSVA
jgi:hypothetical protein